MQSSLIHIYVLYPLGHKVHSALLAITGECWVANTSDLWTIERWSWEYTSVHFSSCSVLNFSEIQEQRTHLHICSCQWAERRLWLTFCMLVYIRHFDTSLDVVYSAPPITIPITVVYVEALCSFLSFYALGLTVWSLSLLSVFKFSSSLSMFFFLLFLLLIVGILFTGILVCFWICYNHMFVLFIKLEQILTLSFPNDYSQQWKQGTWSSP